MEGQKTRCRETASLAQVASGGRPGDSRYRGAEVSLENVHDAEVLATLLNPLRRKLGRVYADSAYDSKTIHQLIPNKVATACIPPRKNVGL